MTRYNGSLSHFAMCVCKYRIPLHVAERFQDEIVGRIAFTPTAPIAGHVLVHASDYVIALTAEELIAVRGAARNVHVVVVNVGQV